MIQKLLIAFAVLVFGVTAASAQSCQDIIDKRQTLMKHSAAEAKIGSSMIKGETPFDLAKVTGNLRHLRNRCGGDADIIPDCSKAGDHTTAAPAIWDKSADFKAAIAKFAADIKTAQDTTKDLDTLKTNFQTIGKDCGSCHQTFRVKPS